MEFDIEDLKFYIAVGAIVFVALITLWVVNMSLQRGKMDIDCSFEGIELTDVRPDECFSDDLSSQFCPIPNNIHCKINGELSYGIMQYVEKQYS